MVDGTARTNVSLRLTNANKTFSGGVLLQSNSALRRRKAVAVLGLGQGAAFAAATLSAETVESVSFTFS